MLGIQFDTMFTDGLYEKIGLPAVEAGDTMRKIFTEKGWEMPIVNSTNQVFATLDNALLEKIQERVEISFWEPAGPNRTTVRFASGWSVTKEDISALERVLSEL